MIIQSFLFVSAHGARERDEVKKQMTNTVLFGISYMQQEGEGRIAQVCSRIGAGNGGCMG